MCGSNLVNGAMLPSFVNLSSHQYKRPSLVQVPSPPAPGTHWLPRCTYSVPPPGVGTVNTARCFARDTGPFGESSVPFLDHGPSGCFALCIQVIEPPFAAAASRRVQKVIPLAALEHRGGFCKPHQYGYYITYVERMYNIR